ncbi:MAG TPA: septum formation initiator family protein [Ktedonobacteraceae bacterium]|nr:septum formation initiator family protein [Ktedonobacteraceae bacterium]
MQEPRRKPPYGLRPANSRPYITSAVGMEDTVGRARARRSSLFTQTVIWVTGVICLAFLLGSLAQAWTNNQLAQKVQQAQQQTQQLQAYHDYLVQVQQHYANSFVIEKEAREQFGYVRAGEHPVVIISADSQQPQQPPHPVNRPAPQSFWQDWWNVFFG